MRLLCKGNTTKVKKLGGIFIAKVKSETEIQLPLTPGRVYEVQYTPWGSYQTEQILIFTDEGWRTYRSYELDRSYDVMSILNLFEPEKMRTA